MHRWCKDYADDSFAKLHALLAPSDQRGIILGTALWILCRYRHNVHWSGHPSRLNRPTLTETYRFGDINYAKEELRAELASVFLAAERGIPHDPEQHAAYVGSWIKSLKEDKNEIFRAAHDASAAADFLLGLERDRSLAEESLQVAATRGADSAGLTTASDLEEETARLNRDREDLEDLRARDSSMQETSPTQTKNGSSGTSEKRLANEHALTAAALGHDAKTYPAQVESGTYRGQIIGETEACIVQRVSSRSAVAHLKDCLDRQPIAGQNVLINYSNGSALVRDFQQRTRERDLAR